MVLWLILEKVINFFQFNRKSISNFYEYLKIKALNNKITYYAVYNKNNSTYNEIHNYYTLFYVIYYMFYSQVKNGGMTIDDYEIVTEFPQLIIIISYIRDGKEYHKIVNNYGAEAAEGDESAESDEGVKCNDIVYAYSYSCGGEEYDLTDKFIKYRKTIFRSIINLNAQHVYNILTGTKNSTRINCIKYMFDIDCEEKIII